MLPFIFSVLVSALLIGALLYVTRQRLARQFADIQRRQVEIERTVAAIKLGIERSTTDAQLKRLHLGLVRIQENMAHRYGGLVQSAARRQLSELQSVALREWADALDVELEADRIEELAAAIERLEMLETGTIEVETPDLLARLIALMGQRDRNVTIGVLDGSAASQVQFLLRVAAEFFDQPEVRLLDNSLEVKPVSVLIFDDATSSDKLESAAGHVKNGGFVLMLSAAEQAAVVPVTLEQAAAGWNTRVYRKAGV